MNERLIEAVRWCTRKGLLLSEVVHALDKPRPHTVLGYSWETPILAFEPPHLEALEEWFAGFDREKLGREIVEHTLKPFDIGLVGELNARLHN